MRSSCVNLRRYSSFVITLPVGTGSGASGDASAMMICSRRQPGCRCSGSGKVASYSVTMPSGEVALNVGMVTG
jgi:hypothetical protein